MDEQEREYAEQEAPQAPQMPAPRRGISPRVIGTVLAAAALLLVLGLFARSYFFRIKTVSITGLVTIPKEQVLALAGIDGGTTYFNLNEEKVSSGINSNRYLAFVSMEKQWPDSVQLTVYERERTLNYMHMGVKYTLDVDGMVLESTTNLTLDAGCVLIGPMRVRDIRVGAKVLLEDMAQWEAIQAIIEELAMQGALSEVAEVTVSLPNTTYLVTRDGYTANIGEPEELRAKIGTVRAVLIELRKRGLKGGTIEALEPAIAYYRPMQ